MHATRFFSFYTPHSCWNVYIREESRLSQELLELSENTMSFRTNLPIAEMKITEMAKRVVDIFRVTGVEYLFQSIVKGCPRNNPGDRRNPNSCEGRAEITRKAAKWVSGLQIWNEVVKHFSIPILGRVSLSLAELKVSLSFTKAGEWGYVTKFGHVDEVFESCHSFLSLDSLHNDISLFD